MLTSIKLNSLVVSSPFSVWLTDLSTYWHTSNAFQVQHPREGTSFEFARVPWSILLLYSRQWLLQCSNSFTPNWAITLACFFSRNTSKHQQMLSALALEYMQNLATFYPSHLPFSIAASFHLCFPTCPLPTINSHFFSSVLIKLLLFLPNWLLCFALLTLPLAQTFWFCSQRWLWNIRQVTLVLGFHPSVDFPTQ